MQNASSVESSVLNANRRRSSHSINKNQHHQNYPVHSAESSLDSSPLPSPSNSIANVKAWLNDQNARSNPNPNPSLFNSTHSTSNPTSNSNRVPNRNPIVNPTTRTSSPAPNPNSNSTSAPPNISDDQSALPPVNHGAEVWNQLYDAMHNENQKLRARLTEAERKAEAFRKENVALKQQLESLTSTTSDPTRANAVSTSTSTSTSSIQNSPNPQSSNIANTALRDVYAPSSSSQQQQQRNQLPSGFSVGGYSSSRRSSAFELNSNHHRRSSKDDSSSRRDEKFNEERVHDPRSSFPAHGGEENLQSPTISEPIIRDPFNGILNQIEPNSTSSNQFQGQISNKRPQAQSMNTLIPNPHGAGWHNHALSGFDSGSSRLTWSQAGELTDRVGSEDGFSNGSGYGFNLAKSPKKNFELHLPREKEKGKGKEKENEKEDEKVDERNPGDFTGSKEHSNREENPSSSINSWASNVISENPKSSSMTPLTTSTTTSIDSRTFNNNLLESSLPNTSSWGELISAHVAHLRDTLPYAVVEKDRLERILAGSSSGGSSLSNGNNFGGFGMQRGGLGKSTSSNGNSMNEMSRSDSKTSEGSKNVINISSSNNGQSPSMTMENEDRGNPSILTSLPLDDTNQISTTSRAAPPISLNATDNGNDLNDIPKEEEEEEPEPVVRNHSGTETEKG